MNRLNEMIWERIPKLHFVGLRKPELGAYDTYSILSMVQRRLLIF